MKSLFFSLITAIFLASLVACTQGQPNSSPEVTNADQIWIEGKVLHPLKSGYLVLERIGESDIEVVDT